MPGKEHRDEPKTYIWAMTLSALSLGLAQPAMAGKTDRAREAIAAAEAKLQAADVAGATLLPTEQASAREELARAKEDLANGHKDEAIAGANHVSMLAEANLGESQKRKAYNAQARVEAARQEAANAQAQAVTAQAQAADANARADVAANAAVNSAADAAAARQMAANAAVAARSGPRPPRLKPP
jgi:hypothetical protein